LDGGAKALVLRQWTLDFPFVREDITRVSVWFSITNLNLHAWSPNELSKIVSLVGIPFYAYQCTSLKYRISYARVLVEVDVRKELPKQVHVQLPNGKYYIQEIWYE